MNLPSKCIVDILKKGFILLCPLLINNNVFKKHNLVS